GGGGRLRYDFAARHQLREDAPAGAGLWLAGGNRLRVIAPQPPQCVREDRRAVAVAVPVFAEVDLHVVAGELERGGHPRVLEIPAAGVVDEVLPPGLHEDANRPRLGPSNQSGQTIGAPEVVEAADPRD